MQKLEPDNIQSKCNGRQALYPWHAGHRWNDRWFGCPLVVLMPRFWMPIRTWKEEDIRQSLSYAAWRVQEIEVPVGP